MGGKQTVLNWDEIDTIGIQRKPGERRIVPVLSATLGGERSGKKSYVLYPRWSVGGDALLLIELEFLHGDPSDLIAACKSYAGPRWQYELG